MASRKLFGFLVAQEDPRLPFVTSVHLDDRVFEAELSATTRVHVLMSLTSPPWTSEPAVLDSERVLRTEARKNQPVHAPNAPAGLPSMILASGAAFLTAA